MTRRLDGVHRAERTERLRRRDMYYRPCSHCRQKKTCARKKAISLAAKELGLTSVRVKCSEPYDPFPPGTPIEAFSPWWRDSITGTVSGRGRTRHDKIAVWLDESPEDAPSQRIACLYPDMLRVIEGPLIHVCPECGKPDGYENRPSWYCETCIKDKP